MFIKKAELIAAGVENSQLIGAREENCVVLLSRNQAESLGFSGKHTRLTGRKSGSVFRYMLEEYVFPVEKKELEKVEEEEISVDPDDSPITYAIEKSLSSGKEVKLGVAGGNSGKVYSMKSRRAEKREEREMLNYRRWTELEKSLFMRLNNGKHPDGCSKWRKKEIFGKVQEVLGRIAGFNLKCSIDEILSYLRVDIIRFSYMRKEVVRESDDWLNYWLREADKKEINDFLSINGVSPVKIVGEEAVSAAKRKLKLISERDNSEVRRLKVPEGCKFSLEELIY